jgi:hypothetical protein
VDLAFDAADHPDGFAKVRLGMARRMNQRHEHLLCPPAPTLADWVGASAATLMPLVEAMSDHVFAAERIHPDDTPVPVLARGKTRTGRLWNYWFDPNRPIRWQVDFCLEKSNHCKGLN